MILFIMLSLAVLVISSRTPEEWEKYLNDIKE